MPALKITKTNEPASAPPSNGARNGSGRPKIPVPAPILEALNTAKGLGTDESLKVKLESVAVAKQFVNQLQKGARELELRLFKTIIPADDGSAVVRFRTAAKSTVAELFA